MAEIRISSQPAYLVVDGYYRNGLWLWLLFRPDYAPESGVDAKLVFSDQKATPLPQTMQPTVDFAQDTILIKFTREQYNKLELGQRMLVSWQGQVKIDVTLLARQGAGRTADAKTETVPLTIYQNGYLVPLSVRTTEPQGVAGENFETGLSFPIPFFD